MATAREQNPQHYPGVLPAYEFVKPSYDWAIQRIEAANARLQSVQTYAATLTFAAPVATATLVKHPRYDSPLFIAALCLFAATVLVGLAVRMTGTVILIRPSELYKRWLDLDEWTFKSDMLHFAGEHMEHNMKLADRRARFSDWLSAGLGLEMLLFAIWIGVSA